MQIMVPVFSNKFLIGIFFHDCSSLFPLKVQGYQRTAPEGNWLYRPLKHSMVSKTLTFIPYCAMANRCESDMRIWIPLHY